jgi:acetolactate synthase-1/2/3 large subunit
MSREDSTVAETIADVFASGAADRIFAFPGGGTNLDLIEALSRRGIDIVVARSEGGAALMAATYADLKGLPAVLLVGLGPGVASVVNGIAHAFLDQSPVVLVSDRFALAELGTSGHQALDQRALLAPVTKEQVALRPAGAAEAARRALEVAAEPPAGPVHLELAHDVAGLVAAKKEDSVPPRHSPRPSPVSPSALEALTAAHRPVLLVGDEAFVADSADLVALAERMRAPVLTSYKGKGAFPETHELWCGIVTNAALEAPLLNEADLLLAIGLDPVELLPRPWTTAAPVIALRAHSEDPPGYRPRWLEVGNVGGLVRALIEGLGETASMWSSADAAEQREAWRNTLRKVSAEIASLTAIDVVEAVLAEASRTTTVTVDAGAHMFAVTWFWRTSGARRFLISNGLATMGHAVPGAIAASLARPGESVVAFTGDGGFLLHAAELETATRLGARIIVIVLNDASLSLIRIKQEDRAFRRQGVDFADVRLADLGAALGAHGERVADADALREAFRAATARIGSSVIEVVLSGGEYRSLQHVIRGSGAD